MEIYFNSEQVYSSTPILGILQKIKQEYACIRDTYVHIHIYNILNILYNVYTCMCGCQRLFFRVSVFLSLNRL